MRVSLLRHAPRFFNGTSNAASTKRPLMIDTDRTAHAFRADSVELPEFGRDRSSRGRRLNLTADFSVSGHASKVRLIEAAVADSALSRAFFIQARILKSPIRYVRPFRPSRQAFSVI